MGALPVLSPSLLSRTRAWRDTSRNFHLFPCRQPGRQQSEKKQSANTKGFSCSRKLLPKSQKLNNQHHKLTVYLYLFADVVDPRGCGPSLEAPPLSLFFPSVVEPGTGPQLCSGETLLPVTFHTADARVTGAQASKRVTGARLSGQTSCDPPQIRGSDGDVIARVEFQSQSRQEAAVTTVYWFQEQLCACVCVSPESEMLESDLRSVILFCSNVWGLLRLHVVVYTVTMETRWHG